MLRAELELDAATFRRDIDQAGNQFRQLGQTADRMAQQVDTAWRSAGQGAERSADGIGAAYRQEATRAEQSASGIGGAFQQAGSRAEGSASGIGSAYRQEAARAESAASGVGSAWRSAGQEGEQSASGIGDAYRNAMERAQASAQGAGETSGGSFVAAFGSRIAALGSRGGPIGLALGATVGVGALAGAKLADTVFDGFHIQAERDFSQASFGFTDEQMERVGTAAGASFGNAWGESVNANINTAGIAMQSGLLDGDATAAEIQPVIEQLSFVSSIMGEEIPAVARAAGQMIKTNLVETPQQAFDLLTAAQQGGLNLSQDLLDSMNEYGVQWQKLGMDGAQAMGTISQLMQGGARDTDIAADVFKEFSLRVIDGSESTAEAFQSLNLNAEETSAAFGKGGEAANEMADTVIDRLNAIEDPVERNRLGLALFGTQWEDLGGAINNLDLSDAKNEMAATNSTLDAMAIAGGGAGASIEAAKNKISVAADEMKVKLAEAFAPMAVDAATWVGEHQNEILGFFASVGTAALDVSAALLNVGAAGMYLGSYMMEGIGAAAQGFVPLLYIVEQIGVAMSHLPGDAGKMGESIRDTARGAIEGVEGMKSYGGAMRDAAGVMNDLAGQLRDGKITLEEFGSRMALATTISNNLGGELEFVRQGVLNIPDSKTIIISDNSPETEKRLTDLGFKVETLPDGTVKVIADDAEAQEKLRLITEPRSKVINIEVRDPTGLVYDDTGRNSYAGTGAAAELRGTGRAGGGPISGPGGPKGDKILTPTSDGEWVIQASAVDKYGDEFMSMVNAGMLGMPRAAGGPVTPADLKGYMGGLASGMYTFGGWGDGWNTDCSGGQAIAANYVSGQSDAPGQGERFATGNQAEALAARGFQPGQAPAGVPALETGWYNDSSSYGGHTAGLIQDPLGGDTPFEMGGQSGDGAVGAGAGSSRTIGATDFAWFPLTSEDPNATGGPVAGLGSQSDIPSAPSVYSGPVYGTNGGEGAAQNVFVTNWPAQLNAETIFSVSAYANGGPIHGPGTGTSDDVPILASNGEWVMQAAAVDKYGVGFMDAVNAGRFAAGGGVGFGGYSDDTTDAMKPKNWYDWAALTAGVGFAAASVVTPYVNMATSGSVTLGDLAPTVNTSANSIDGVAQALGKEAEKTNEILTRMLRAVQDGKKINVIFQEDNLSRGMLAMSMTAAGM